MNTKKLIHSILTDKNLSVDEKYKKIIELFPDYLQNKEIKKAIYEKIEWIFHDWLWTYFELLVYDNLVDYFNLKQEKTEKELTLNKINEAKILYNKFFPSNEYKINFDLEVENIEQAAKQVINYIKDSLPTNTIIKITHSAQDFRKWNARDVFITFDDWKVLNLSLKVDKSWKVALFDGQTSDIFNKVYNRYFNLSKQDYENLKQELFGTTDESKIFKDFQNVALLNQEVLIKQLGLENVEINDFSKAVITNKENLKYLISQLKRYKKSDDNSIVVVVDRISGKLWWNTILDEIDENNLDLNNFSFTPTKPRSYKYATEPWIKFKWKTFVSFQTKHKRWNQSSSKFWDITIRLRTTWK